MPPSFLISGNCECAILHFKETFQMWLSTLRWGDFPELSGWAQYNHKGSFKGKRETEKSEMGNGSSIKETNITNLLLQKANSPILFTELDNVTEDILLQYWKA